MAATSASSGSIVEPSEDDRELRRLIAETTPFSAAEAQRIRDPAAFLERFQEIEQGNHYESEYLQAPHRYHSMDFAGGDPSTMSFDPDHGRIFARLSSDELEGDSVLVKWYDPQSGESLYFDQYPVKSENSMHPLWLDNRKAWEAEQYHVEVFTADESLRLLSAGTFYVDQ
ncbi:MAG: hypothetical protein ACQES2_12215 [Pseudomonadota bacterium]